MLYHFLKKITRPALRIICRNIVLNRPEPLKETGPLLLAANHPNSFLDSVIINSIFEEPVWSLARGDAFRNNWIRRILGSLMILPVYRTSEGVENLSENYKTFEDCITIFKKKGIVTIYSEGRCINEWHLRPLKKGTARLAIKAWEQGIPLRVLPLGINYSSFTKFGKNVFINFGEIITADHINMNEADGIRYAMFNQKLETELKKLVFEIPGNDLAMQKRILSLPLTPWKKFLLALPALIGLIGNAVLYLPVKTIAWKHTRDNDHFDSVMASVLLLLYPFYLLLLALTGFLLIGSSWIFLVILLLPICAWCFVQARDNP